MAYSQHAGENSQGRPAGFQLLSTEPDFTTRSYSFLGYVRSQPNVFISAGIGDFFLGLPAAIQAEYAWTTASRLSPQCTRVRLSAGAAGAAAAAGVFGTTPLELAERRAPWGGDPGTSSALRQRFGSEALGILARLAHFGPPAEYSVSRL